jgi:hypothetical protein
MSTPALRFCPVDPARLDARRRPAARPAAKHVDYWLTFPTGKTD